MSSLSLVQKQKLIQNSSCAVPRCINTEVKEKTHAFPISTWKTNENLHNQTTFNFKLAYFGRHFFTELFPLCIPTLSEINNLDFKPHVLRHLRAITYNLFQ